MILGVEQSDFAYNFLSLLLEGAPYIVLGTVISGFIDAYMPGDLLERKLPKNRVLAVLLSGLMGLVLPVCECAVVPVIRRLVGKGLPVSCAFTYMLAAPIVNPVTMWSTWHAFSGGAATEVMLSRIGLGFLVAATVGLLLLVVPAERVLRESLFRQKGEKKQANEGCEGHVDHGHHEHEHVCCGEGCGHEHHHAHEHEQAAGGMDVRLRGALRAAMTDCVDVAVYFTIGVCLTAIFNILYVQHREVLASVLEQPVAATGGMMGLAFVLSVCSTTDAFMAAALKGVGMGGKMAFLVFGPMMDVKLLFLYQTVMRRSFLWKFALGLFVFVGVLCWGWGIWFEGGAR